MVQLASLFYPNSNRAFSSTYFICMEYGTYFYVYYCGSMRSCYMIMSAMIFAIFFNSNIAYLEPVTAAKIAYNLVSALGILVIVSFQVVGIDLLAI